MTKSKRTINADDPEGGYFSLDDFQILKICDGIVKKCGNGAHVSVPLAYLGKKAYIVIRETESPVE